MNKLYHEQIPHNIVNDYGDYYLRDDSELRTGVSGFEGIEEAGMRLKTDPPQPSFQQELDILRKIAGAASDVSLAHRNKEFAELAGGIDVLNNILFDLVYNYERTLSDMDV